MYLDDSFSKGGGFAGRPCKACREPILSGQPSTRVEFTNNEHDMSGEYHSACSKPFDSIARALNMLSRFGR